MEENLINKENEVTSTNNNSNNKNGIIAILVVIIIVLIGVIAYLVFIKPDDKPVNNKETNTPTPTPTPESTKNPSNSSGISKKIVFDILSDSCPNSVNETFNDIKVEVKNAKVETDSIGCVGEIFINDKKTTEFDEQGIDSIEIYDKYVIVYGGTSANGELIFYDTKNNNAAIKPNLGKYFQSQGYLSDDEGLIVIAASHAGEYGAQEPEHDFRKLRIKYTNGSFGTPELIEEYDEYRELVK